MASSDSRVGVFFMPKTTSLQPALQDTKHQQVMNALQALRSEVHSLRLEVAELRQQQAEQAVAATSRAEGSADGVHPRRYRCWHPDQAGRPAESAEFFVTEWFTPIPQS